MKSTRTRVVAAAAVVTTASLLAACSSSSSGGSGASGSAAADTSSSAPAPSTPAASQGTSKPAGKVTISVVSLIPGSSKEAFKQFDNQVKEFELAYPNITVNPSQYQWTGPTFAARLAAGTLPIVFTVPFTDGKTLSDKGQLADLTAQAKALPYFGSVQSQHHGERHGLQRQGLRPANGGVCERPALQPQPLQAGRP